MRLIVLFGPPAVGKMTVGQELSRLTGYKLFHNHMTIDLVTEFFEFGTPPFGRLVSRMRRMIISEAARDGLPGLIFTFVWGLNLEDDHEFVQKLAKSVETHGGEVWLVELAADTDERLRRNQTENRRRHKPKMPLGLVDERIRLAHPGHVLNSSEEHPFPYPERHFRLDTTALTALEAAERIESHLRESPAPPRWL